MKAFELKTEYLVNPLGLATRSPRLYWKCEDGVKQTAYELEYTVNDKPFPSVTVKTSSTTHISFPQTLASRDRVLWRVRLRDENGVWGEYSDTASFEMSLLDPADFSAEWISGDYCVNKRKRYPVDCFRKTFEAENVVRARLYATACGLFEAKINGNRVGDFVLAPGHTDYLKRVRLLTFDVTPLLKNGENEITAELADGGFLRRMGSAQSVRQQNKTFNATRTVFCRRLFKNHYDGRLLAMVKRRLSALCGQQGRRACRCPYEPDVFGSRRADFSFRFSDPDRQRISR